ncbi:hypothetical protein Tco_0150775 [Tanacetum coccineum]
MNELNKLRDQAYENSLIYKEKTKKIHDSKIKNRVFNIGDRVLLFNSRLKIFSGKLKTRWTGPFIVAQTVHVENPPQWSSYKPYTLISVSTLNYVNLINYDLFTIKEFVGMLEELGLGDDKILVSHFRIPSKSLNDGLIQLMADEDVLTLLKFVLRFKGVKVYIEADVPLIEQDMMKVRSGQAKGVVIEQIVKDDRVEKLLLLDNGENVVTNSEQVYEDVGDLVIYEKVGDREVVGHVVDPVYNEEVGKGKIMWLIKPSPKKRKRLNQDERARKATNDDVEE